MCSDYQQAGDSLQSSKIWSFSVELSEEGRFLLSNPHKCVKLMQTKCGFAFSSAGLMQIMGETCATLLCHRSEQNPNYILQNAAVV